MGRNRSRSPASPSSWNAWHPSQTRSDAACRTGRPLLPENPPTLGIAGLGLIGASIALRAAELGWKVAGYDPDSQSAVTLRGALAEQTASFATLAERVETLVLAGPLDAILAQLAQLAELAERGAAMVPRLILDVASVKALVAAAGATLPTFVGTHPMAGSERSGAQAARSDLFMGRTWAYDPAQPRAAAAEAFIRNMGAVPVAVPSAAHDRIVALTSHLPQVASVALAARLSQKFDTPHVAELCGPGVRSMVRLGDSPWPLWRSILGANATPVAQELRGLAAILSEAAQALENGETDRLGEGFAAAARAVGRLRASEGAQSPLDAGRFR